MTLSDPTICSDLPFLAKVGNPVWCEGVKPFIEVLLDLTSDPCALLTAFLNSREIILDLTNRIQDENAPKPTSQTECNFHIWWEIVIVFANSVLRLVDCLDKSGQSQFDQFDVHASHGHCWGPHVPIGLGKAIFCFDEEGNPTGGMSQFRSYSTDTISGQIVDFHNALVSICDKPPPPPPPPPGDIDKCCAEVIAKMDAIIAQLNSMLS